MIKTNTQPLLLVQYGRIEDSFISVISVGFLDACLFSFRHILTCEPKQTPCKETECHKNKSLGVLRDYKDIFTFNKVFGDTTTKNNRYNN